MKKTEFVEAIKTRTEQLDYGNVCVEEINKGSRTYLGMYIKRDNVPTPVIDLDALYFSYTENVEEDGVEGALTGCMGVVNQVFNMKPDFDADTIRECVLNWDWVKPRLVMHPVDEEASKNGLYEQIGEDYLCPYIDMSGGACIRVTSALLDIWKVSKEELFGIAILNDLRNLKDFFDNQEI